MSLAACRLAFTVVIAARVRRTILSRRRGFHAQVRIA